MTTEGGRIEGGRRGEETEIWVIIFRRTANEIIGITNVIPSTILDQGVEGLTV